MSRLMTRSFAALALTLAVAACSSNDEPATPSASPSAAISAPAALPLGASVEATPPATPEATPEATADTSAADAAAVRKAFADYNQALLARDFATACTLTDPSAATAIIQAVVNQGASVSDCAGAFAAIYGVQAAVGPMDNVARGATVTDVDVDGDVATVTYSAQPYAELIEGLTNKLKRTDGAWRLLASNA